MRRSTVNIRFLILLHNRLEPPPASARSRPAARWVRRTRDFLIAAAASVVLAVGLAPAVLAQVPAAPDSSARSASPSAATDSLPGGPLRRGAARPSGFAVPSRSTPLGGAQQGGEAGDRSRGPTRLPPRPDPFAPDLIERYRTARNQVLTRRLIDEGRRGVTVLSPVRIPTPSDSLRADPGRQKQASADSDAASFSVQSVHALRRLERGWFQEKFADTEWSFLGSGRYFTIFDTTRTRELRARLQAQFGAPTQVLADFNLTGSTSRFGNKAPDDLVQFEYWFVVNDSIPVKVMDAGGPRDRGLIIATDARLRDRLFALRQALLKPLRTDRRAPYVDYWQEDETRRWYRTGFDGARFFLERIPRWKLEPGRPEIDSDAGR